MTEHERDRADPAKEQAAAHVAPTSEGNGTHIAPDSAPAAASPSSAAHFTSVYAAPPSAPEVCAVAGTDLAGITFDAMATRILEEMYAESAKGVVRERSFDLEFARRLRAEMTYGHDPEFVPLATAPMIDALRRQLDESKTLAKKWHLQYKNCDGMLKEANADLVACRKVANRERAARENADRVAAEFQARFLEEHEAKEAALADAELFRQLLAERTSELACAKAGAVAVQEACAKACDKAAAESRETEVKVATNIFEKAICRGAVEQANKLAVTIRVLTIDPLTAGRELMERIKSQVSESLCARGYSHVVDNILTEIDAARAGDKT